MDLVKGPTYFVEFSNMGLTMQAKFYKYWNEYNLALSYAAILDNQYKVTFLKYCFVKIYGSESVGDRIETVINTRRMWFEEYMRVSSSGSYENVGPSTSYLGSNFTGDKLSWMIELSLSLKRQHISKWVRVSSIYV